MNCDQFRARIPDVAAGVSEPTADEGKHLATCAGCGEHLKEMRATMALLDEWQTPEPSPYFDVRLQARLREEMAKPQVSWLYWFRRPVLAAALTVLIGIGVGLFFMRNSGIYGPERDPQNQANIITPDPGTAVGDLQALDDNPDLYADFEILDDLDLQQDVVANP